MGLQNLLGTGQRVQFKQNGAIVFQMDCSLREVHGRESPASDYEIEDGTSISDNIVVKPITLEIQGLITDTPISLVNSILTAAASALPIPPAALIGGAAGIALVSALDKTDSRSVSHYQQLLQLQVNRQRFTVITSLSSYDNMWIKSLSVPREAGLGQTLAFTVTLQQLTLVSARTVNNLKFSNADLSGAEANGGTQQPGNLAAEAFKHGNNDFRSLAPGAAKVGVNKL